MYFFKLGFYRALEKDWQAQFSCFLCNSYKEVVVGHIKVSLNVCNVTVFSDVFRIAFYYFQHFSVEKYQWSDYIASTDT